MKTFFSICTTLCAIELVDIMDFLSEYWKIIIMSIITLISGGIQLWKAIKEKKYKDIPTYIDKIQDGATTIAKILKGEKVENIDKENLLNMGEENKMFEVNMTPLVQEICNLYSQDKGLNFPPCTQQMINAIAQWVNTRAIDSIKSVVASVGVSETDNKPVTLTITYTHPDGSTTVDNITFDVPTVKGNNGQDGADGVGIVSMTTTNGNVIGNVTSTPVNVTYTDGRKEVFYVTALNGVKGADGADGENGVDAPTITSFVSTEPFQSNGQTVTPITVNFSNGTHLNFNVHAQNGENAQKLYMHEITIRGIGNDYALKNVIALNTYIICEKEEQLTISEILNNISYKRQFVNNAVLEYTTGAVFVSRDTPNVEYAGSSVVTNILGNDTTLRITTNTQLIEYNTAPSLNDNEPQGFVFICNTNINTNFQIANLTIEQSVYDL